MDKLPPVENINKPAGTVVVTEKQELPEQLFPAIAAKRGAIWLDSSLTFGDRGRYSFIAGEPILDIALENNQTIVRFPDGTKECKPGSYFLGILNRKWNEGEHFSAGYIGYEAGLMFLQQSSGNIQQVPFPSARFLFYNSVLRFTHKQRGDMYDTTAVDKKSRLPEDTPRIIPTISQQEYIERVNRIKRYIHEGDIYQANYTTRFDVASRRNPLSVYMELRRLNPAPYGAYLNFGDYQIISSSPERMFLTHGKNISTGPIKGTISRGNTLTEQQQNLEKLLNSEKDKAELLMIVDLMRNDLGKIARTGSVTVDTLFSPQVYSSLIHLVSDISAQLREDVSISDIICALLPGGSITGAPKLRAIEIINELEQLPRFVYTGCIGYVYKETADFNIAIRTMTHANGVYHVHAGGGIVADSDPVAEYNEMRLKARNLFRALGVHVRT